MSLTAPSTWTSPAGTGYAYIHKCNFRDPSSAFKLQVTVAKEYSRSLPAMPGISEAMRPGFGAELGECVVVEQGGSNSALFHFYLPFTHLVEKKQPRFSHGDTEIRFPLCLRASVAKDSLGLVSAFALKLTGNEPRRREERKGSEEKFFQLRLRGIV